MASGSKMRLVKQEFDRKTIAKETSNGFEKLKLPDIVNE